MMNELKIKDLVAKVAEKLEIAGLMLITAESCTGGFLAKVCTDLPAASSWFDRGFVVYQNEAKVQLLHVSDELIQEEGAVSEAVAGAMAKGAVHQTPHRVAVAITGVAGPSGGSQNNPVGTVWFGLADSNECLETFVEHFEGDREFIREQAVIVALESLLRFVG